MSDSPILPGSHAWRDAQGRPLPVEFYRFLRDLVAYVRQATGQTLDLAELARRVADLEHGGAVQLRGISSVVVRGGTVQLLQDQDNPAGGSYYGTNAAGERGFWPVVDAMTAGAGLTKAVPTDGYNVLGELDSVDQLPGSANVGDAYFIDGEYWVWDGSAWSNEGPPSNSARLSLYPGTADDDGLLWDATAHDYVTGPVVRNPMTAAGDLIYGGSDGKPARLAIGAEGQVLTVIAGVPVWTEKGDVVGPAGAEDSRIAVFDGGTGKAIKDSGYSITDLRALAQVTQENIQTDDYTLQLTDAFKLVTINAATAKNVTVPADSSVAFPVGTRIDIGQDGAGQVTVVADSGVTIRTPETMKLRKQWAKATLIKRDTDTWDLNGNLEAAP